MRALGRVVAAVLALAGLVWTGQGLGLIKGSFMTGDQRWLSIGLILLVVSLGLFALTRRAKRPAGPRPPS
ncbi:MAG TPA: hypothetical protein VF137_06095 [Candidatus Dormibacteraeota bacterium]